ncbi:DUF1552 domain-containing protein [Planctomycetales bacterium ZRK34]|nr:DUF1552 domain-containing protein [Planctomycetales bacterium ZRK34]
MNNTRTTLSRRMVLRGVGAALSMPLLEAMSSSKALAAGDVAAPLRTAFVYVPNGVIMDQWTPTKLGRGYDLPATLQPLAAVKDDVLVLSGLAHDKAKANGDGAGDHARCGGTFLTGVQVRKTSGKDIRAGISVDQIMATRAGGSTRLSSLEIGCEPGRQAGNCDSGYSCAYSSNISWRTPAMPMAKEVDPRQVFNRLFGDPTQVASKREAAEQASRRKSVLDLVRADAADLRRELGSSDQRKLDEYLDSVREIERRVQNTEQTNRKNLPPDTDVPEGVPSEYADHVRLMYDLMALALRTDSTRVISFMHANAGSNRSYRQIGVNEGHHSLSHHQGNKVNIRKLAQINHFHMTEHARFIQQLKDTPEAGGSLLDHCMVLYGCAISDGNRHSHIDLPILLAGRAGGTITPGRHVRYKRETPLCNLFMSMLNRMNTPVDSFGDSTGQLDQLSV